MHIKIPKRTYTFTSPMDSEFCTAKLNLFLGEAWNPSDNLSKRHYLIGKEPIIPTFKLTQMSDDIQFSAILIHQPFLSLPRLYLSVSGYIEEVNFNQAQIILHVKEKSHLFDLFKYGTIAFIFGLGTIFATPASIVVSLLSFQHITHVLQKLKHI